MEPKHFVTLAVSLACLYFASSTYKDWVASEQQVKLQEIELEKTEANNAVSVALSDNETKRLKIITEALAQQPKLSEVKQHSSNAHEELLKSARHAEGVEIQGVSFQQEQIKEIFSPERRVFQLETVEKESRILKVDTSVPGEYKVTILLLDNLQRINCLLEDDSLEYEHRKKIIESLANRKKITLILEARNSSGELRDVKILGTK